MRLSAAVLALLVPLAVLPACASAAPAGRAGNAAEPHPLGSGADRTVPSFDSVHVASGLRATVTIGPLRPVHFEADPATLARLDAVVEDGELRVGLREGERGGDLGEVTVTLQTPELHKIGASGGSIVTAQLTQAQDQTVQASGGSELRVGGADAGRLRVQASGGSTVHVTGRAQSLALSLSGGSRFGGKDFETRDVELHGSGGAEARLAASGEVRGSLSGGSQLWLRGGKGGAVRVSTSGGSEVHGAD